MSRIHVKRSHDLGRKKALKRLEGFVTKLREEYEFESEWQGRTLHIHRPGAEGKIRVAKAAIEIDVELSAILGLVRGTIESRLVEQLDELFPETAG